MATTNSFKKIIDTPLWKPIAPFSSIPTGGVYNSGVEIGCDLRGRNYAHPEVFMLNAITSLYRYNVAFDSWLADGVSPGLNNTVGLGSSCVFVPGQGPKGTLAAGGTTTSVVLTTALLAAPPANSLANRGDGLGYIIRIVQNTAAGAGKTNERRITGNTSSTTPTITFAEALDFTPANGDTYEILSGRVFFLATGAPSAGSWKYLDVATNTMSGNLVITNLPTIATTGNTQIVPLDEQHVPSTRYPGEGFLIGASTYDTLGGNWTKGCLLATGSAAGTLTGQAAAGDAAVLTNEYRNFQIRVVEDTAIPTAVGQRRRITSHTAGASPVYTLASNWTVTPSTTCKYVVENDNDKLILWTSGTATTYNYNHTANTWDTSTWATKTVAHTNGPAYQSFGITPDAGKNARHSHIFALQGSASVTYSIFDIAGAATGSVTNSLTFNSLTSVFLTTDARWGYVPFANEGRYVYIHAANIGGLAGSSIYRFDMLNRRLEAYSYLPVIALSTTCTGNQGFVSAYIDGATVIGSFYTPRPREANSFYQLIILG